MQNLPENNKQWAIEAFSALKNAWDLLKKNHPSPSDKEKNTLIDFAPIIAAKNRGITDENEILKAIKSAQDKFKADIALTEKGEPIHYSICFLLTYLDSLIIYDIITEKKLEEIMDFLTENYDINYQA